RVERGHVPLDHLPGQAAVDLRLRRAGVTLLDPATLDQVTRGRDGALRAAQPPPAGQRVVHAGAEAVVRPRRAPGRGGAAPRGPPGPGPAGPPPAPPGGRAPGHAPRRVAPGPPGSAPDRPD